MLREITLGQYYPAESILHSLDPRVKLFGTLIFIITLFSANNVILFATHRHNQDEPRAIFVYGKGTSFHHNITYHCRII